MTTRALPPLSVLVFVSLIASVSAILAVSEASAADGPPKPFRAFARKPVLRLPITPYTSAPESWTEVRVDEAFQLAARHLARCAITLEWSPVQVLPPHDDRAPERLWRTPRPEELVLVFRGEDDDRYYRLAGVANLWRRSTRSKPHRRGWFGDAAWSDLVQALAQEIDHKALPHWPRPTGAGAADAIGKARLALMWAAARDWISMSDMTVSQGQCKRLRKLIVKARAEPDRPVQPAPLPKGVAKGMRVPLSGPPTELLAADVPNRDAVTFAARVGNTWHLIDAWTSRRKIAVQSKWPAAGRGLALLRVGGASLLLSEANGGVHAAWLYPDKARRSRLRPDRQLKGCDRLLAADVLRPQAPKVPSRAVIVCPDRVYQLSPDPKVAERDDSIGKMAWATLTRRSPSNLRLLAAMGGAVSSRAIRSGEPPAAGTITTAETALFGERPTAPIWTFEAAHPAQLAPDAVYGLPGPPRPIGGEGTEIVFNPQLYRVARARRTKDALRVRLDALYDDASKSEQLPASAQWAMHRGDYAPSVWVLTPHKSRWWLRPIWPSPRAPRPRAPRPKK